MVACVSGVLERVGLLQGQLGSVPNINLFTDASGSFGAGAWFNTLWFLLYLATSSGASTMVNRSKRNDPVVVAATLWGNLWER